MLLRATSLTKFIALQMTNSATGLKNPYGTYRHLVRLLYISGLILMKGQQEPYVQRSAKRVRRNGLALLALVKSDIDLDANQSRLLKDLLTSADYLKQCGALEHALPAFKELSGTTEREIRALTEALGGGWSDRMFPMLAANDQSPTSEALISDAQQSSKRHQRTTLSNKPEKN